jgi:membrane protease YdiL (CAAX protease family)
MLAPAVTAATLKIFGHWEVSRPAQSIFEKSETQFAGWTLTLQQILLRLGPGAWFLLASLVLLGIGLQRAERGNLHLPVRFRSAGGAEAEVIAYDNGAKESLGFVLLAYVLTFVAVQGFAAFLFILVPGLFSNWFSSDLSLWAWMGSCLASAGPLVAALLLARRHWKEIWLPTLRSFPVLWVFLTFVIPVAIDLAARSANWFAVYVRWFLIKPNVDLPQPMADFFAVPSLLVFVHFFPILLEELGWRAYFQPRMVSAFGVRRGLMLVGLVWAIWHFPTSIGTESLWFAAQNISARLLLTTLHAVVIGWIFLRTNSVWPAATLHLAMKAMVWHGQLNTTPWSGFHYFAREILFVWLAWMLFRRWPQQATAPLESPPELPDAFAGNR